MCMAVDAAIYLSNKIIDYKKKDTSYSADVFKIHKMLYYAQGFMLVKHNKKMFNEVIRAHRCGAFVEGLDYLYVMFGKNEITKHIDDTFPISLTEDRQEILDFVAKRYGCVSRESLIFDSKKDPPYVNTWNKFLSEYKSSISIGTESDDILVPSNFDEQGYLIITNDELTKYFVNNMPEGL